MKPKKLEHPGEKIRMHDVVAVEEPNVREGAVGFDGIESGIACGGNTAVDLMNHAHAPIALRVVIENVERVVRGAVVDSEDDEISVRLIEKRAEALADVFACVVDRQNHGCFG